MSGEDVRYTVYRWAERWLEAQILHIAAFHASVGLSTKVDRTYQDAVVRLSSTNVLASFLRVDNPTRAWGVAFRASNDPPRHAPDPDTNKCANFQVSEVDRLHEIGIF